VRTISFEEALREVVGYLNFSSGGRDPRFFATVNRLFLEAAGLSPESFAQAVLLELPEDVGFRFRQLLCGAPERVEQIDSTFRDTSQARAVLRLAFDVVIPAYRSFHRDLLEHQEEWIFHQPFFVARVLEAILQAGEPWEEEERIVREALSRLNDYVGYRPVAVLETRKYEPYLHERLCTVPLYISGAGLACSPYAPIVRQGLEILRLLPPSICQEADFYLDQLEEMSFDPRPLDPRHPLTHRPNHVYGTWDPHRLNQKGRFCRYVVQQVILDFLRDWLTEQHTEGKAPPEALLLEAGGALVGTLLMSVGITGGSPSAIPSTENLSRLVLKIARYREEYYEWLFKQVPSNLRKYFHEERQTFRTPFGSVRRALNQRINDYRTTQSHRARFVELLAEVGQEEILRRQLPAIRGVNTRMEVRIYAAIHSCRSKIEQGLWEEAARQLPEIFRLILRGIDCGALVDPWNALGFSGFFPLSPAPEDSVLDERIPQLIALVERLFDLHAEVMKAAAAVGRRDIVEKVEVHLRELAEWWDQFATTKVSGVVSFSGKLAAESARAVAAAIHAWYQGGAATGDVGFWREHVSRFPAGKAYASAIQTLLEHNDLVGALALMINWVQLEGNVGLRDGSYNFPTVAARWMYTLWEGSPKSPSQQVGQERYPQPKTIAEKWQWTRRFFDYLEVNGPHLWKVPQFQLASSGKQHGPQVGEEEEFSLEDFPGEFSNIFAAAYEGVVYRDSALDGVDSELLEKKFGGIDPELLAELKRLSDHLLFLVMLATLWQYAAFQVLGHPEVDPRDTFQQWLQAARRFSADLRRLLLSVMQYHIEPTSANMEDMTECGQRLQIKETLLHRIIETWVSMEEAVWTLAILLPEENLKLGDKSHEVFQAFQRVFRTTLELGGGSFAAAWKQLLGLLEQFPWHSPPLEMADDPEKIVRAQVCGSLFARLANILPRKGKLRQTLELITRLMNAERVSQASGRQITQLAEPVIAAMDGMARAVALSADNWPGSAQERQEVLFHLCREIFQRLFQKWRSYGYYLLVSPAERLNDVELLQEVARFIADYGHDLFTQAFLSYPNLLGLLKLGPMAYIQRVIQQPNEESLPRAFEDVRDGRLPAETLARFLRLILEPVVSYYSHYIDYNSSTPESDRGENLMILLRYLMAAGLMDRVLWTCVPFLRVYRALLEAGKLEVADQFARWVESLAAPEIEFLRKGLRHLAEETGVRLLTVERVVEDGISYSFRLEQLRYWATQLAEAPSEDRAHQAAQKIEELAEQFLAKPRETGFEAPEWLEVLQEEFERQERIFLIFGKYLRKLPKVPAVLLEKDQIFRQCQVKWKEPPTR